MNRTGEAGEFSPCEKMYACQLKLAGDKFPTIRGKFMKRFRKMAPLQVCHESHGQEAQDQVFCLGQEEGDMLMLKLVPCQLQLANKHFHIRRGGTCLASPGHLVPKI